MPAFSEVQKIKFEGPQSKSALAFKHYNETEAVEGKSMKDHFRFSVAYWRYHGSPLGRRAGHG